MAEPDDIRDPGLTPFNVPGMASGGPFANLSETVLGTPSSAQDGSAPLTPAPPRGLLPVGRPPTPSPLAALPELYKPKAPIIPEPPKAEYRDPLMALGQPLSLVALLGSLFVRQPATAAMNAMAAAMEAQKKGDQQKYENHYKEYVQQVQKANQEQQEENRLYEESYANRKMTFDERMAQMKMTAARRKDNIMQGLIDGGGNIDEMLKARVKAGLPVTEAMEKTAEMKKIFDAHPDWSYAKSEAEYKANKAKALEDAKSGTGETGDPTLHGEEYLKTLSPGLADKVRLMAEYKIPIIGRSKETQKLLEQAARYDPAFDATNYNARQKVVADFTSGATAKNITAMNTLVGHLGALHDAASDLNNTKWPSMNTSLNYLSRATGDPRIRKFETIASAVADEATKVFKGTSSEGEIHRWREQINASDSPAQLQAAISALTELMKSRLEALGQQWERGSNKPSNGFDLLDPHAQKTFTDITSNPVGKKVKKPGDQSLEAIWGGG